MLRFLSRIAQNIGINISISQSFLTSACIWADINIQCVHPSNFHLCVRIVGCSSEKKKMTAVLKEDTRKAACNTCKVEVMRGGCRVTPFITKNVVSHLKNRHPEFPKLWQDANAANGSRWGKEKKQQQSQFASLSLNEVALSLKCV